ncbi:MAG: glucose-6-phosphate isomerase, partial [Eubacteriales bacterium]
MNEWKNLDELKSFQTLKNESQPVDLTKVMAGEAGAGRVAAYQVPMAAGLIYSYAAKQVDDGVLNGLKALAEEAQLAGKFEELYNGAVINTGEKRLVLHQLTRGQLGNAVIADGTDKRSFYAEQQEKIAAFASKVHSGEIVNEKGEKFTTVCQ